MRCNAAEAQLTPPSRPMRCCAHMAGLGGDGFWLIAEADGKVHGINASGPAARLATLDTYRARSESLLHGGLEWRVGALRRYPSSDAHEFGLPELAHSVERFDRDGNLCRASGVVA